jgi:hypothetical protein
MVRATALLALSVLCACLSKASSFAVEQLPQRRSQSSAWSAIQLFDKMFEESGALGKGITVGKVQVALFSKDRSRDSIFGFLQQTTQTATGSSSSSSLARLAHEVCLKLLRKQDDWTAACSESKWFNQRDSAKAEGYFNDLSNREAAKFEKVR